MRLAVEQRHGECLCGADAVYANEQHNRTTKACPLADVDDEGLRVPQRDDAFDAVGGLLGTLHVCLGLRAPGEPDEPVVPEIEGWILGREMRPMEPDQRPARQGHVG